MINLPLTAPERTAYEDALRATRRTVRFSAQLYSKTGSPLPVSFDISDGEVNFDATNVRDSPTRTAHITITDPKKFFVVDWADVGVRSLFFNKQMRITYGVYVASLSKWVDVPVFHGWLFEVTRRGAEIDIDLQGKEAMHLPPSLVHRPFAIRKHTKVHTVIHTILGNAGETDFDLQTTNKRIHRDRVFPVGAVRWRACVNVADGIDKQLFYDGRGRVNLRNWPDSPAWTLKADGHKAMVVGDPEETISREGIVNMVVVRGEKTFTKEIVAETSLKNKTIKGATSITVNGKQAKFIPGAKMTIGSKANPETRTIDSRAGSDVFFIKALDNKHAKGAKVVVKIKEDATKAVIGKAELGQNYLLSKNFLDFYFLKILDKPSIHDQSSATNKAEAILDRARKGLADDIQVDFLPVPHLEEGDRIRIETLGKDVRIRTMSIPLTVDGLMSVNWHGTKRLGKRGKRHGK